MSYYNQPNSQYAYQPTNQYAAAYQSPYGTAATGYGDPFPTQGSGVGYSPYSGRIGFEVDTGVPRRGGEGKLRARTCTDVICAGLLLLTVVGMGFAFVHGLQEGLVARVSHGFDWEGKLCGVDLGREDKKFIYFCKGAEGQMLTEYPICMGACPATDGMSVSCPAKEKAGDLSIEFSSQPSIETIAFAGKYCMPTDPKLEKEILGAEISSGKFFAFLGMIEGLRPAWWVVLVSGLLSMLAAVAYLFVLRQCGRVVLWSMALTVLALIVVVCIACFGYHDHLTALVPGTEEAFMMLGEVKAVTGGCLVLVALAIVYLMFDVGPSLSMTAIVVEESISVLFSIPSLLLIPCLTGLVQVLFSVLCGYGLLLVVTAGKPEPVEIFLPTGQTVMGVHKKFVYEPYQAAYLALWLFGSVWILETLAALGQFVVAYSVTVWYYTPRDDFDGSKDVESGIPFRALLYGLTAHIGSLALAGVYFFFFRIPAAVVLTLTGGDNPNPVQKIFQKICVCQACCMDRVVVYVQPEVFTDIACNSRSYFMGAVNVRKVTMHALDTLSLLNGTTMVFTLLGVTGCGLLSYVASYGIIVTRPEFTAEASGEYVENPLFVSLVSGGLGAFLGATVLFTLGRTADSLVYCLLNDNTGSSAYLSYAPPGIRELLGK
jgi:hypothetical protein